MKLNHEKASLSTKGTKSKTLENNFKKNMNKLNQQTHGETSAHSIIFRFKN